MAKAQYKAKFKGSKYNIDVKMDVYIWQEDGTYFVYSPALDLTGYDKSEELAKKSFTDTLDSTLTYMQNKDTLFNELERLGWTVNRNKKRVNAPNLQEIMSDNDQIKDVLSKVGVRMETQEVHLALA